MGKRLLSAEAEPEDYRRGAPFCYKSSSQACIDLQAPAPGLTPELRADLSAKAIAAAEAVHYVGAGTVEFIFDNDTQKFYFMEM